MAFDIEEALDSTVVYIVSLLAVWKAVDIFIWIGLLIYNHVRIV